ncbi:MAG: hypothetical protein EAZ15_09130 [Sphingobacteriales bacterium]|nr:MAG: hypothetical protein EAZ15_09130 [Sphingobacteriales bacterium]
MLQRVAVKSSTLELLIKLMNDSFFNDFVLVGGTALALQIAHRDSIDLDFFCKNPFDATNLLTELENRYNFKQNYINKNTLKGEIDNVKVDFIAHQYPNIEATLLIENVRMAALPDIAAMKLNAIMSNGTRLKDFIDIAYLSSFISLDVMHRAYREKYTNSNPLMIPKALTYFEDIDFNEPINLMVGKLKWQIIEKRLLAMVNNPSKKFTPLTMQN